ncbi:M56 family metallopeptidase [uncultured Flavobacterium sp.]|uniref:M56 family metallopeptidase n=1 Tax=uncultured Flavobacterium sp. TaxID=165435 RepID=UPI00261BD664|nr:M56 family metallopeptidase [uncultured Flavobacterium sp.]
MENLLLYFAKANGLIILFYLMYVLFLRKETFFVSNRWYFISGLILSLILPLITFTKTIWVEPSPIPTYNEEVSPITYNTIAPIEENPLDWSLIATTAYAVISILIVIKITMELASFFNKIRKHQKQKETDFTLIHSDTTENPFSFFHYIVINPNQFSKEEFQHILTHESIHVKQKHSIDVLLGKLFCAFFWVNPIIWFYRKAMLQNLEFIADSETFQQIENKYEYQRTLLKVVTHQHDLSITNQFYQSLIKKRIVMLHTNQSHKRNVWKYATILPLIVGFMLLFQIETIAQVKENPEKAHTVKVEAIGFSWDKKATDEEMKSDATQLKSQGIDFKFSNVKRNKNGEIIAIKIEFTDGKGNKGVKEIDGDEPIEPIYFSAEKGKIGFTAEPDYSDYVIDKKLSKIAGSEVKVKKIVTEEILDLPEPPTPPTPPNHPYENFIDPPLPPDFPNVPDLPSNFDNKKAMAKYEKAMAQYEKKMKALEPKMKEFEKKMEAFEKEMKLKEPDMKQFEEEMKVFEEKMKVFEKEMEVYQKKLEVSTEYYINGEKVTKEEVDKMQPNEIKSVNVRKNSTPNRIEIKKKEIKKTK